MGQLKTYQAVTGTGLPIISVGAENETEAKREVARQLDRDGRRGYLRIWRDGGERLVERVQNASNP